MAFHIFDNADQLATFWICVITTPICILLIIFRFTTKNRNGRKVGMEDWFALVALFFYLIWVAFALASKFPDAAVSIVFSSRPRSTLLYSNWLDPDTCPFSRYYS